MRGRGASRIGCRVTGAGAVRPQPATLRWEAIVPARGRYSVTVAVAPILRAPRSCPARCWRADAGRSESARRLVQWHQHVPQVASDHLPLLSALHRSAADLGALRVIDAEFPGRAVVAAGAPWHLALHGRDALLTAWMSLIVDPELALGTLETLARFQGADVDDRTEEQPGRILHRLRFGAAGVSRGAHRSATGRSTPRPCSSCCSASCAGGASPPRWSSGCCPTPTGRSTGSRPSAIATATGTSSTSA